MDQERVFLVSSEILSLVEHVSLISEKTSNRTGYHCSFWLGTSLFNFHLSNLSAVFADHCFSRILFLFVLSFLKVYVLKLLSVFSLASLISKSSEAINDLLWKCFVKFWSQCLLLCYPCVFLQKFPTIIPVDIYIFCYIICKCC